MNQNPSLFRRPCLPLACSVGLALVGFSLSAVFLPAAGAAVLTVDRTDEANVGACTAAPDDCTLRGAITTANSNGQTDTIVLTAGATYTLATADATDSSSALPMIVNDTSNPDLTIQGNGATITRDAATGTPDFRLLHVSGGAVVTLNGVTFSNGRAPTGGAIYSEQSTLTLIDCSLVGSTATAGNGGGIRNDFGKVVMTNCFLAKNVGISGAAFDNNGAETSATATINGSRLIGNKAGAGGAIYNFSNGGTATLTINDTLLAENSADTNGGSIYQYNNGTTGEVKSLLTDCTFYANHAGSYGGAIYGTGADSPSAKVIVRKSTFVDNSANYGGGAIGNQGSTMEVRNSTLSGNQASSGGAIVTFGSGRTADLTITNSTLCNNSSPDVGGGIYNSAAGGTAKLTIGSTIFKTGESGENIFNSEGTVVSDGYNLSNDDSSAFLTKPTDKNGVDPKLGVLQNNGGSPDTTRPTYTHALLAGSPAIDHGPATAPTTDQRGYSRRGVPDIGAFEFDGPPPSAFRVDALIRKQGEATYSADNVYQLTPHDAQVERQNVTSGVTATYEVKIENDTPQKRTFRVRALGNVTAGWTVIYRRGGNPITTAIRSENGYRTITLQPGGSDTITVAMRPTSNAAAHSHQGATLQVFVDATNKVTRDAVQAVTTLVQPNGAEVAPSDTEPALGDERAGDE